MPLPDDEKLIALGEQIIAQFDGIFGLHPGFRPAHAKGAMLTGTFTPTEAATALSKAPHFSRESTPVTARFSNSTGLPTIPDTDGNANPRGLAIRFHLAEHVHTDIVSHSTDGFPGRTGDDFLGFLKAIATSPAGTPSPTPFEQFLGANPAALAFVQTPKPFPASFATEAYFGVNAMEFINAAGDRQFGRYQIAPLAGLSHLTDEEVKSKGPDYLYEEMTRRLPAGFKINVQLADPGDIVDDATIHWPSSRRIVELGRLELTELVIDNAAEQKKIIFDPIPRVDGIEPSHDPLLELRAAIYLMTGRRRRKA